MVNAQVSDSLMKMSLIECLLKFHVIMHNICFTQSTKLRKSDFVFWLIATNNNATSLENKGFPQYEMRTQSIV